MAKGKNNKRRKGGTSHVAEKLIKFFSVFMHTSLESPDFTMGMYIRLVVDNDLKVLRKYPIYIPKLVYAKVYENLIKQYVEISGNEEIKRKKMMKEKIHKLYNYHEFLRSCYIVLASDVKDEKKEIVRNVLKGIGANGDYLIWLQAEIKSTIIKIKQYKDAEEGTTDKGQPKKATTQDFASILQVLHKNGYKAGRDMCVIDYTEAVALLQKEIKEVEKLKSK